MLIKAPAKNTQNSGGAAATQTTTSHTTSLKCGKCGKKGHKKAECRKNIDDGSNAPIAADPKSPSGAAPAAIGQIAVPKQIDEESSKKLIALLASSEAGKKQLEQYTLNLCLGHEAGNIAMEHDSQPKTNSHFAFKATVGGAAQADLGGQVSRRGGKGWSKRERKRMQNQEIVQPTYPTTFESSDTDDDSSSTSTDEFHFEIVSEFGTSHNKESSLGSDSDHSYSSGYSEFSKMKKSVVLVNAARGGIVNENALVNALTNNTIRAAALDVYEQEPPPDNHQIFGFSNVLLSPHNSALTLECRRRMAIEAAESILYYLSDKSKLNFNNIINKDVLNI